MSDHSVSFLQRIDAPDLAYMRTVPESGSVSAVWLGGYASDMLGDKASHLHQQLAKEGRGFVRFDYSGHGQSQGRLDQGSISLWRRDSLDIIDMLPEQDLLLIGSSLGGWLALLAALARPERVRGLVLIAPAADFTERLIWQTLTSDKRRQAMDRGYVQLASEPEDSPTARISCSLIEDGRNWLLMEEAIGLRLPVRILQGGRDDSVPLTHNMALLDLLESEDVVLTLIKDADHRLSRPADLLRLGAAVDELLAAI